MKSFLIAALVATSSAVTLTNWPPSKPSHWPLNQPFTANEDMVVRGANPVKHGGGLQNSDHYGNQSNQREKEAGYH